MSEYPFADTTPGVGDALMYENDEVWSPGN